MVFGLIILALIFAWFAAVIAMIRPFSRWFPFNRRKNAFMGFLGLPWLMFIAAFMAPSSEEVATPPSTSEAQLAPAALVPAPVVVDATKATMTYSEAAKEGRRQRIETDKKLAALALEEQEAERIKREAERSFWSYNEYSDMHGKAFYAEVTSTNSVTFGFPYAGGTATLTIRNHPKYGTDVYLHVEGQFVCHASDDCVVMVKFDEGKPSKFSAAGPADYSSDTLFIQNAKRFIAAARKAKKVTIEATFFQEGDRQFVFPIQNFAWNH